MTRVLLYTLDAIGEYTIAEDNGDSVTIIGRFEEERDARLFCAAPELLDALETLIVFTTPTKRNAMVLNKAHAAIAKALGETK